HRLLRDAGLTGWRGHVWSCGFEIDVVFEADRVAIEVDGWAWHRDAHRQRRDAERQNVLDNAWWHVLRFTWHTLVEDPDGVIRQIRAALDRRR
ncbi:MAG: endonuclease domain-containing protein, partial [Rhodococcus sp. (in: high G+C Gram-positive bacteria)]|uniref:endonuclease domain-containing protein n=1 Tax=Rhodococcus sp. TaxID=1831 RepID=UPI003D9B8886